MRTKLLIYLVCAAVLVGAVFYYRGPVGQWLALYAGNPFHLLSKNEPSTLPPPLRSLIDSERAYLTVDGTITSTNAERVKHGLLPLVENSTLNKVAERKLKDMFDQQYFEHESPQGRGPSDLADLEGYKYILVGENLALGNFADDATLVTAWMNSPGHRANILNSHYREIGVAVGQGQFEGKRVWLAVQSFGTPLSVCPQPSASLKDQIERQESVTGLLRQQVDQKRAEMESYQRSGDVKSYNREVDAYNALVNRLNSEITTLKQLSNQYNQTVEAFNLCLKGNS